MVRPQRKAKTMTKKRPLYRVTFAAKSEDQPDKLTKPVEIGAVWPRTGNKRGGILRLDRVPDKLQDGVIFILPVTQNGGAE